MSLIIIAKHGKGCNANVFLRFIVQNFGPMSRKVRFFKVKTVNYMAKTDIIVIDFLKVFRG